MLSDNSMKEKKNNGKDIGKDNYTTDEPLSSQVHALVHFYYFNGFQRRDTFIFNSFINRSSLTRQIKDIFNPNPPCTLQYIKDFTTLLNGGLCFYIRIVEVSR